MSEEEEPEILDWNDIADEKNEEKEDPAPEGLNISPEQITAVLKGITDLVKEVRKAFK